MDNQNQQLNPQIVATAQSIGQAESGGSYNAPTGKAGETGAYQMTPAFISEYAPKYLGSSYAPGQPLNPQQQDQLAYDVINGWVSQENLSPAQIASKWNTGKPDAYLDPTYGKNNAYGSTQNYVDQVEQNYNQNYAKLTGSNPPNMSVDTSASQPNQTNQTAGSSNLFENILNGALGLGATAIHGIASHPGSLSSIGTGIATIMAGGGPENIATDILGGEQVAGGIAGLFSGSSGQNNQPPQTPNQETATGTDNTFSDFIKNSMTEPSKQSQHLQNSYAQALGGTIAGRNTMSDPNGQNAVKSNAMFGYAPVIGPNGEMDFTQAQNKSLQDEGAIAQLMQQQFEAESTHEGTTGDYEAVKQGAKQWAHSRLPESQWQEADKVIDNSVGAYEGNSGRSDHQDTLGRIHKMKMEMGRAFDRKASTATNIANKAVSLAAKSEVLKKTKHSKEYQAALKMEQNMIKGRQVMKMLQGKKAPKHFGFQKNVLNAVGKAASIYIGDKIGGPAGAMFGLMVEEKFANIANKKYGKTIFETKQLKKDVAKLKSEHPGAYKLLEARLRKGALDSYVKGMEDKMQQELQVKKLPEGTPTIYAPAGVSQEVRESREKIAKPDETTTVESKKHKPKKGIIFGNQLPPLKEIYAGKNKLYKGYIRKVVPKVS